MNLSESIECVSESIEYWVLKVLSEFVWKYWELSIESIRVFVMVSWRQRRWWPHISCPSLSGSGFSLLAVLLFTLLLTRTCLEFRISRFSSPLLAFRYRPLYYSSALTHTNFHNTPHISNLPSNPELKMALRMWLQVKTSLASALFQVYPFEIWNIFFS